MSEKKFEALAQDVSNKASSIPCSREDYVEGLEIIIEFLQTDVDAAKEGGS